MRNWIDMTMHVEDDALISVCRHDNHTVSLSLPGYTTGHGVSLYFNLHHLPKLLALCAELKELEDGWPTTNATLGEESTGED